MLMHEGLVRLENILTELSATDLGKVDVENVFSLMRKDYLMPKQLEY